MARTKQTARRGEEEEGPQAQVAPAEAGPSSSTKRRLSASELAENRKKQRADEVAREEFEWKEAVKTREFTCERQVVHTQMPTHPMVEAIRRQGLTVFFDRVEGYRKLIVRRFYEHMVHDDVALRIESTWGGVTVVVTPRVIAEYLGYTRPAASTITFPKDDWARPVDEVISELTEHPEVLDQRKERFVAGGLRELYRSLNKVLHYNINPHGTEKTPTWEDGKLLYAFGSGTEVCDWAELIWKKMVEFRRKGTGKANIPFPVMITHLCEKAGVRIPPNDVIIEGRPGPLTYSSIQKSKTLSLKPSLETAGSSRPTSLQAKERTEQWMEILVSNQKLMLGRQRKILEEQKRAREEREKAAAEREDLRVDMRKVLRMTRLVTREFHQKGGTYEGIEEDLQETEEEEEEEPGSEEQGSDEAAGESGDDDESGEGESSSGPEEPSGSEYDGED